MRKDGTKEDDGTGRPNGHRRTNSFSSLAKAYRLSKNEKHNRSSNNLNKSLPIDMDDTQQLIAVLEHHVSEGDKARRDMATEIATLKDQLQRAETQIALLKQANSNLYAQLLNKEEKHLQYGRLATKPTSMDLCLSGELRKEIPDSPHLGSPQWNSPLNDTIYADSMHDDSTSEPESDFSINTIINNINVNTYNNINNIRVNSINEINYIIDINNINTITNYNNTNNYHTVNNINSSNVTVNNFSSDSTDSPPSTSTPSTPSTTPDTSGSYITCDSLSKTKDDVNTSFSDKEKRVRQFGRTAAHHKRRGSDTESSTKLDEKCQRRHSEGKVLRIVGLREQIRQAVLQILNTGFTESEDDWPSVHALLQGVELSPPELPPPPRHLVHAGFVREGEEVLEGYWVDDVLLLLFENFLVVACQPKSDSVKAKYHFKEIINLTPAACLHSWETDSEHFGIRITTEQCGRSFLISSKEEYDKWLTLLTKHITALSDLRGAFSHYLIAPCEGFVVETTTVVPTGETKLSLEEPRKGIYHYQSFFYSKPHINYVGGSNACPIAISIEDKTTRFALSPTMILRRNSDAVPPDAETVTHRALVRTQMGDECVCIAIPANFARSSQTAQTEILAQLAQALPELSLPQLKMNTTLFRVKSPDLENDLLQYEANNMRRCHKIGVVYCARGARTEAEMLHSTHAGASADFLQFLFLLGQEVTLKNWPDYSGGLDVKNDTDGTHSIFTNFWGIPVMFHVSTMLPNDHNNPGVSKKRHIGNDIVVLVFKDHDDDVLFVPSTFKSHLNHIFCVVQHVNNPNSSVSYKVSFCAKEGIGGFMPALPSPPIFAKDAKFKHFLLAKIVNAERAAMRSAPFAKRHTLARFTFLKNLWRLLPVQPKEIDETYGQTNTM